MPEPGKGMVVGTIITTALPDMVVVVPISRLEGRKVAGIVVGLGIMRTGVLLIVAATPKLIGRFEGGAGITVVAAGTTRNGTPSMVVVLPSKPAGALESGIVVGFGIMMGAGAVWGGPLRTELIIEPIEVACPSGGEFAVSASSFGLSEDRGSSLIPVGLGINCVAGSCVVG